jgi:hypothetical protein
MSCVLKHDTQPVGQHHVCRVRGLVIPIKLNFFQDDNSYDGKYTRYIQNSVQVFHVYIAST